MIDDLIVLHHPSPNSTIQDGDELASSRGISQAWGVPISGSTSNSLTAVRPMLQLGDLTLAAVFLDIVLDFADM